MANSLTAIGNKGSPEAPRRLSFRRLHDADDLNVQIANARRLLRQANRKGIQVPDDVVAVVFTAGDAQEAGAPRSAQDQVLECLQRASEHYRADGSGAPALPGRVLHHPGPTAGDTMLFYGWHGHPRPDPSAARGASSGIPDDWAASGDRPGVHLLADLSERTVERIAARTLAAKQAGDVLVASIHWGGNWSYEIPAQQRRFAHGLIDRAGFDVVHGHSSHHPKGIEVYRGKPILYGCGDFLNDYEGIAGYDEFRDDLVVMYLPRLATSSGQLVNLSLRPFQIRKFRLNRASEEDAAWLRGTLNGESSRFGVRVKPSEDDTLSVTW